jgi:hypothetical protein
VSPEVRKEVMIGWNRHVLVPAFLASVDPPADFRSIHASDLVGWDGNADTPGVADLIYAIANLIGNPATTVTITPVQFVIVVGWKKFWPELGPTVNLTCQFDNKMKRPVTIHYLALRAAGPEAPSRYLTWEALYDTVGPREHTPREAKSLALPAGNFQTGVQFRAPKLNNEARWPAGSYKCQILGWADRPYDPQAPNLRTDFEAVHQGGGVRDLNELFAATDAMWAAWVATGRATNNARGVDAPIGRVRAGLPAIRASAGNLPWNS